MPSKNMLPKGKRRQSVKQEYRAARTLANEQARKAGADDGPVTTRLIDTADFNDRATSSQTHPNRAIATNPWIITTGASGSKVAAETHEAPRYANPYQGLAEAVERAEIHQLDDLEANDDGIRTVAVEAAAHGLRLDAYLAKVLPDISRARVVTLIEGGQVSLDGKPAKASHKLKGGEHIEIEGEPALAPLHAEPEDIPLHVVFEDDDLLVVNKPAGMMVHAGSGDAEHNRGTLVNALLFRLQGGLSSVGGEARPGIVHRLDKDTSGLIVVARNDVAHRKLSTMFSEREVEKTYIALVHGWPREDSGTVSLPIARDQNRRIRMTTRRPEGRSAVTHWRVLERITSSRGKLALLEVNIETGRTHQIRVHMSAVGHAVVGDTVYGAPGGSSLNRNFLHAAELRFHHPRTAAPLHFRSDLPAELTTWLESHRT